VSEVMLRACCVCACVTGSSMFVNRSVSAPGALIGCCFR